MTGKAKPILRVHPNNDEIWFIDAPKGYRIVIFDQAESDKWIVAKLER